MSTMQHIADKIVLPVTFLKVSATDELGSDVTIRGSFQKKEDWSHNIFHNSPYFIFMITPPDRFYQKSDNKFTIELVSKGTGVSNFRKYTGPIEKVLDKLKKWVETESLKGG